MADVKISGMTAAATLDGTELLELTQAGNTRKGTVNAILAMANAYADALAAGLRWKDAVRAATTADITLSGAQTIDGVSVIVGDRVLVKNQSAPAENGIYVAASAAWARASDANTSAEVKSGTATFVTEGTANSDKGFVLSTNDPITLDTTALTFVQFSGVGAGITNFIQLLDVPSAYTGEALKILRVNAGETALEFVLAAAGAPPDADYLVGTAHAGLSGEIVVGTSPGGELSGTWASPTVDASHSGSTHAAVQAAAEATAAADLSAHITDTTDAHDASAISVDTTGYVNSSATELQALADDFDAAIAAGGSVATDAIWDAKGDLAVGTGSNTAARLAVGSNTYVLTADSAEATGLKWAAGGGSGAWGAITGDFPDQTDLFAHLHTRSLLSTPFL